MKKICSLLLSFVMVSTSLLGCANVSDKEVQSSTKTTISETESVVALDETEVTKEDTIYKEGKYPIYWDLTDIYESDEAWKEDYDKAIKLADEFPKYRGTLNTTKGLYDYFKFANDSDLTRLLNKLNMYASFKQSLNIADSNAADMLSKCQILSSKCTENSAFADEEIFSIPIEDRIKMFEDPLLKEYAYSYSALFDPDTIHYSEETIGALNKLGPALGAGYDIFSTMAYLDMPYPEITMPDGSIVYADEATHQEVMSGDYEHDFKVKEAEAYYSAPKQYANTYALALEYTIRENIANAQLDDFDSYKDYVFDSSDIDPVIYEKIKKTAHDLIPIYGKYIKAKKQESGLNDFYVHELSYDVIEDDERISYDEAVDNLLEVLSIYGDDYISAAKEVIDGHVDVYPATGKDTGGFENSCAQSGIAPYVLLNYYDDLNSESTLFHEMGHAMYSYASENGGKTNLTNNTPTIFTHEVTSITNEFLLTYWGLKNAKTDEEKLPYLRKAISLVQTSLMTQMMYSEFEEYLYETVENGGALDPEVLSDKWMELNRKYYGDEVEFEEDFRYRWCMIPHFHYGFYVYMYATSCTYAAATSSMISEGNKEDMDNYKEFLSLGASKKPEELLKVAGIDIMDDSTYEYIKNVFSGFVDEYIELSK